MTPEPEPVDPAPEPEATGEAEGTDPAVTDGDGETAP